MGSYSERVQEFNKLLAEPRIDIKELRQLCFRGIPDKPSLRAVLWKLLLNYLPLEKSQWSPHLTKQRNFYKNYVEDMVVHPDDVNGKCSQVDHPLNDNPDSQWGTFFKDNEILLQIDRDVRRLSPDISFFQQPTQCTIHHLLGYPDNIETLTKRVEKCNLESSVIGTSKGGLKNVTLKKVRNEEYEILPNGEEAHWQVVERILFVFAKLNPGIAYVQGMNEILGPLYYTFASDPDIEWQEHAEEDAFFCFTVIMGEIRDNFIKSLDNSAHGIGEEMNRLLSLLQVKDLELWTDLQKKQVKPQFFAFRWITLLLSQEFILPDVMRLWDSLFSDPDRFEFLLHVCCAMLVLLREHILKGDFAVTLKMIQNFPHDKFDMATVIQKAVEIRSPDYKTAPPSQEPAPSASLNQPVVKSISERGRSLRERLSMLVRNETS